MSRAGIARPESDKRTVSWPDTLWSDLGARAADDYLSRTHAGNLLARAYVNDIITLGPAYAPESPTAQRMTVGSRTTRTMHFPQVLWEGLLDKATSEGLTRTLAMHLLAQAYVDGEIIIGAFPQVISTAFPIKRPGRTKRT